MLTIIIKQYFFYYKTYFNYCICLWQNIENDSHNPWLSVLGVSGSTVALFPSLTVQKFG